MNWLSLIHSLTAHRWCDLKVMHGEPPRHERPKHLNEKIHRRGLSAPLAFLYIQTAVTICLIIISFSGPLQLWEMVRTLSLSDVIVTAASLKPLSFLPGDSQQMTLFWNRPAYICLSLGWLSAMETLQMTRAMKLNYSGKVYRWIRACKQWPHGPHVIYHGLSQKNGISGLSVIIHLPWCLHKVRVH